MGRKDNKRSSVTTTTTDTNGVHDTNAKKACQDTIVKDTSKDTMVKSACQDTMMTMKIDRNLLPKQLTEKDIEIAKQREYPNQSILNPNEEAALCRHITQSAKHNYGFTYKNARVLAYELALQNNKNMPETWKKNKTAGKNWLSKFMKRNKSLSFKTCKETTLSR